jgi:plasmid stabilization system protein ParE
MKLRFTIPAQKDLSTIYAYITDRDLAAADRVVARLRDVSSRLALNPHLGHPTTRKDVRVFSVRTYPYVIYYRIRGDALEILHIRHTARRPWDELE